MEAGSQCASTVIPWAAALVMQMGNTVASRTQPPGQFARDTTHLLQLANSASAVPLNLLLAEAVTLLLGKMVDSFLKAVMTAGRLLKLSVLNSALHPPPHRKAYSVKLVVSTTLSQAHQRTTTVGR